MIPSGLLGRVHVVRDSTLRATCELFAPTRTPDGRGAQLTTWTSQGLFPCRLDAMESGADPRNFVDVTKRVLGLTLPHDAPRLGIGWRVLVDGSAYTIEKAHDQDAELVIRRYDVSIGESDWVAREQSETVRDDDWDAGTEMPVEGGAPVLQL